MKNTIFPSAEWLEGLKDFLNADPDYAKIAKNWEGDISLKIVPDGPVKEPMTFYLDLWHGTCREAKFVVGDESLPAKFEFEALYSHLAAILKGELDTMQAMMTRKLKVNGNMGYLMRNVPTVLDFVRCAKTVTSEILKDN